jgi:hypothetical protein
MPNGNGITSNGNGRLWPYSPAVAFVAIPLIWTFLVLLFYCATQFLQWSVAGAEKTLLIIVTVLGFAPVILMLVDFVAERRGKIGNKWLAVDFSRTVVESGSASLQSFTLADNILSEAEQISDSGGTRITEAIKKATAVEIVCVDLKDGNAWWVTRLLAICAGATGAGSPSVIAFVGRRENRERIFLGWGRPRHLLRAIVDSNPEYRSRLRIARLIAQQIALFGNGAAEYPHQLNLGELRKEFALKEKPTPTAPPVASVPIGLHPTVGSCTRYYDENEDAMLARILIAGLRGEWLPVVPETSWKNLEDQPNRLTTARLMELFDPWLYKDSIDRSLPDDQQLSDFLASAAPYLAIVQRGVYQGMLRADFGERAIIRKLFSQTKRDAKHGPTIEILPLHERPKTEPHEEP